MAKIMGCGGSIEVPYLGEQSGLDFSETGLVIESDIRSYFCRQCAQKTNGQHDGSPAVKVSLLELNEQEIGRAEYTCRCGNVVVYGHLTGANLEAVPTKYLGRPADIAVAIGRAVAAAGCGEDHTGILKGAEMLAKRIGQTIPPETRAQINFARRQYLQGHLPELADGIVMPSEYSAVPEIVYELLALCPQSGYAGEKLRELASQWQELAEQERERIEAKQRLLAEKLNSLADKQRLVDLLDAAQH